MDIDFEITKVIYQVKVNTILGKGIFRIYQKGVEALNKKWNSLYYSNNTHIFASIKTNSINFYLKTYGEAEIKVNEDLDYNKNDILKITESFSSYKEELNIKDVLDSNRDFEVIKSNCFVLVKAKDIYEAMTSDNIILLENFNPLDFIDLKKILLKKIS